MKHSLIGMALFSLALSAQASLEGAEETGNFGAWTVSRSIETETGKPVCIGIHGEDYETQLMAETLFIGVEGGIREITLKFDGADSGVKRNAQIVERMSDTVVIEKSDFRKAIASNKLLVQVQTKSKGLVQFEYDMRQSNEAVKHIKNECLLPENKKTS